MPSPISVSFDKRQIAKVKKRSERWRGKPLHDRMSRGTLESARSLVGPMRSLAPRRSNRRTTQAIFRSPPGQHRRSIKARASRDRGIVRGATVGPTDFKRHWVIQGTNPHSLAPRVGRSRYVVFGPDEVRLAASVRHPGASGNPYVDVATQRYAGDVTREVAAILAT